MFTFAVKIQEKKTVLEFFISCFQFLFQNLNNFNWLVFIDCPDFKAFIRGIIMSRRFHIGHHFINDTEILNKYFYKTNKTSETNRCAELVHYL